MSVTKASFHDGRGVWLSWPGGSVTPGWRLWPWRPRACTGGRDTRRGPLRRVVAMQRARTWSPGAQSDLSDAEWLSDVAAHGMVCRFVPLAEIWRARLTRYRRPRSMLGLGPRLEKSLQDAGIKLTSVASSVWLSPLGDDRGHDRRRRPQVLAQMASRCCLPDPPRRGLQRSLRRAPRLLVPPSSAHLPLALLASLSADARRLVPFEAAITILSSITGCRGPPLR